MKQIRVLLSLTLLLVMESRAGQAAAQSPRAPGDGPLSASAEPFAQPVIHDPWEGMNRKIHGFNNGADRYVLRPLASGYAKWTPVAVQTGISRFFANLSMPLTVVNQALQGRPNEALRSSARFATNTTIGIGGFFDPASRLGIRASEGEDFGQTLATWGWSDSRYLVLPLMGPRTLRDAAGIIGDQPLSPLAAMESGAAAGALHTVEIVDMRAGMLPLDAMREGALDDYALVRDAWAQHRKAQIRNEGQDEPES